MLRAIREFIQARQPHTDFQVQPVSVLPWQPALAGWDVMDVVATQLRQRPQWQAVMGWRVSGYDRLLGETRFQAWWWCWDPAAGQAWDLQPAPWVRGYILDQALVVYGQDEFRNRINPAPPDLWLTAQGWQFRVEDQVWPLAQLDRPNLRSQRARRRVEFDILASSEVRLA